MLLLNYRRDADNQTRALGGQLSPVITLSASRWNTFYVGENNVANVTDRMSLPSEGYRPPYGLLIAPKEGGMSVYFTGSGTVTNAAQVAGMAALASLNGSGVISNAAMGLTVEMIAALAGSGNLSAAIIGQLQASAALAGSGNITAAQSALAKMLASLAGSGVLSNALSTALGKMSADIYVNQSQAEVTQIVDGVWDALIADHLTVGTTGKALSDAGGAGNPWSSDAATNQDPGTMGEVVNKKLLKLGTFVALK